MTPNCRPGVYSEVLTQTYLTERGWSAVTDYLNPRIGVLDFLVASKVISPLQYTINAEESVQALLRNAESLGAEKLLTPLQNWLVFEKQIAWILAQSPGGMADSVITLGGEDERTLWEAFHRGCSDDLSAQVRHIYLRPMPMPSYRSPWQEAGAVRTHRPVHAIHLPGEPDAIRPGGPARVATQGSHPPPGVTEPRLRGRA